MTIHTTTCVHGCKSITAGFRSLEGGTATLQLQFDGHLTNSLILFIDDPIRAEMIANAINKAEDDYERLAAERADDGTQPDKDQNKEHRLGAHELLGSGF